jgi:ABC-type dipeptide/oligopeptide/nickel transport system permease component
MITAILVSFTLGLVTGLLVMRKHKSKADSIEAKGKTILDALKGK